VGCCIRCGRIGSAFFVARLCSALGWVVLVDGFVCVVGHCGFCILVLRSFGCWYGVWCSFRCFLVSMTVLGLLCCFYG